MPTRRRVLGCLLLTPRALQATEPWRPERPIRLVVPFAPGSSTDLIARVIAARLAEELGGQVIVENRAGAGGLVASQLVARAVPDGCNLLFGGPGVIVAALLQRDPGFDPMRDFQPVASIVANPALLVVQAARPWHDVAALAAASRARPGGLTYASGGVGTPAHLAAAALVDRLGMRATHVPYRGANEAALAVAQGDVDFAFAIVNITLSQVAAGVFRPLLLSGAERSPLLPGVPSLAELVPGLQPITAWNILLAPAGLAEPPLQALHDAVARMLDDAAFAHRLRRDGGELIRFPTTEALAAAWAAELPRQRALLSLTGARAE